MGRVILWTLAVCSVLIALRSNAVGWTYSNPRTTTTTDVSQENDPELFLDLLNKLNADLQTALTSIKNLALFVQNDVKNKTNNLIKPLLISVLNQTRSDLSDSVYNVLSNYIQILNNKRIKLSEKISNGLVNLTPFNPIQLITELERMFEDKEYEVTGLLLCLKLTNDPIIFNELLQFIYDYPENKEYLQSVVRQSLASILYNKYLDLSNNLKNELKNRINLSVRYLDKYINNNNGDQDNDVDSFISIESQRVIAGAIDAVIDKLFDDANRRSRIRLEKSINVNTDVIISIDDTNTTFF